MEITYADIGRARLLLGYNPRKPIEEGIRLFAEWFKTAVGSPLAAGQPLACSLTVA